MATIRKRGDKYHAQFRRKGFDSITRSFHHYKDAQEWARDIEAKADRKGLAPNTKVLAEITLAQLVERYRDSVVPALKGAARERITIEAFLREPICKKSLASLTTADFVVYRDAQLKRVTPKSLQRMLAPINHMFRLARDEWDIPVDNPLTRLRLKAKDNKRQRRLSMDEFQKLTVAAERTRNPYVIIVVQFALETAMRRGEILALRWRDVDTERRSATILEAKNGHSRTIPLTPNAIELIEAARVLDKDGDKTETDPKSFIFPLSANGFQLSWQRLVKRAGINDLHFHDLRHEAISRLFEKGLTVPEVASISGHRDARMLFRYAHANQDAVRAKLGAGLVAAE